jgi:hypothetical protein
MTLTDQINKVINNVEESSTPGSLSDIVSKKFAVSSTSGLLSDFVSNVEYKNKLLKKYKVSELKYKEVIRDIETNNIYDTSILINDLKNLPEIKAQKGFFKKFIEGIFGSEDRQQQTDIESFFSEIENQPNAFFENFVVTDLKYEELTLCYIDFREYFLTNKEELLITLKNNTLKRLFKNETKNKLYQKLSRLNPGIPLMMRLREFLYNIFSVKKAILNYLKLQMVNAFLTLKILYYGNKKQNRLIMLAY